MHPMKRFFALLVALLMVTALLAACSPSQSDNSDGNQQEQTDQGDSNQGADTGEQFEFPLMAYTRDRPYNPLADKLAEAIQAELAKSGVKVNIKALPWAEFLDAVRNKGEGDAFLLGWIGDNGDVDNFLYTFFHSANAEQGGLNITAYRNDTVDRWLKMAQERTDPVQRARFYLVAQRQISQDAVWVPISHSKDFLATTKVRRVTGLQIHPTGLLDLRHVKVEGKDEFIFGRGGDSVLLDPAKIEDGPSAQVVEQIYEGLYTYKPGNTEVIPLLADGMPEVSDDGTVYTIKLKQGIKFHDGTPFNAEAVKYSIERMISGNPEEMPYAGFTFGMVEKVEAPEEYTVVITLKEPVAPFVKNLAMGLAAPIVPPSVDPDTLGENPIGTGPFIFESWEKDQQIVLRRNPDYWNQEAMPKVEKVIFKVIKEPNLRADAVIKGEVDAIDGISPADVQRLRREANLLEAEGMNISYMGFRTDRPPFDNVQLRRAITMLIDRESLVKGLYGDTAVPALTYIPPFMQKSLEDRLKGIEAYTPTPEEPAIGAALQYNPEEGKAILRELGYSTK